MSEDMDLDEHLARNIRMAAMSDRALVQSLLGSAAKYITDEEVQQVMDAVGEMMKRSWYRHRVTSKMDIDGGGDAQGS